MKNLTLALFTTLLITGCASKKMHPEYTQAGCQEAWKVVKKNKSAKHLRTLVKEDCAVLYREEWRLSYNGHKGNVNVRDCAPAWNKLKLQGLHKESKLLITQNCPVLYREGFIL